MDSQKMEKIMKKLIILSFLALAPLSAGAQNSVTYALPRTVLVLNVEAQREVFYAGPYAKYSEKYLGVPAPASNQVRYSVTSVDLTAATEADQSVRYSFVPGSQAQMAYLQLTSQGLVSGAQGTYSAEKGWKYPVDRGSSFSNKGIPSNLTERTTTLYEGDTAVQQSVIVEKSLEAKAKEVADKIFEIRRNKYKILVGDTDATYSGEAMKATIDALNKLENDYLTLFTGYSEYGTQTASFEVIPTAQETQMYIAFRISDSDGLVPAENVSGTPYLLELDVEPVPAMNLDPKSKVPVIYYRIPAICNVKLTDGASTLLQARVPVYQLGALATYPVMKK